MRLPAAPWILLAVTLACSQPPPEVADLVIRDVRVVVGDGSVIDNATVIVVEGRLAAVGEDTGAWVGAQEIDGTGRTVLPGLIDSHVHLLALASESAESVAGFRDERLPGVLSQYLEHGITTVRSTGDPLIEILDVREELRSGALRGPRLFTSGPVLTAVDGHPAVTVCGGGAWEWCRENLVRELPDEESARAAVAELAEAGVDFIKFANDGDLGAPLERPIVEAIVAAAQPLNLDVVAHAGPEAFEAGVDGLVHLTFGPEELDEAALATAVERSISCTVGLVAPVDDGQGNLRSVFGAPWTEEDDAGHEALSQSLVVLWEAGSPLAFGTDTPWLGPARSWSHEAGALLDAGLTPADVLVMATSNAARAIGIEDETGTVEVGKRADLLVVEGRPDEDLGALENLVVVVQDGALTVDRR